MRTVFLLFSLDFKFGFLYTVLGPFNFIAECRGIGVIKVGFLGKKVDEVFH